MQTLAKYHACNHCVNGEKTFQNILIGLGKLTGLSRNEPQVANSGPGCCNKFRRQCFSGTLFGPLHMSPVDRAGSVSDIPPCHSILYKNFDVFI